MSSTVRISPVNPHAVDLTEVRNVQSVLATFPPSSEVASLLRDVLDGVVWNVGTVGSDVEVRVTRTLIGTGS